MIIMTNDQRQQSRGSQNNEQHVTNNEDTQMHLDNEMFINTPCKHQIQHPQENGGVISLPTIPNNIRDTIDYVQFSGILPSPVVKGNEESAYTNNADHNLEQEAVIPTTRNIVELAKIAFESSGYIVAQIQELNRSFIHLLKKFDELEKKIYNSNNKHSAPIPYNLHFISEIDKCTI